MECKKYAKLVNKTEKEQTHWYTYTEWSSAY